MAHPIQIILTRQLAGYLSVPLFLVDPNGTLLFYNEPAEAILGRRFEETGAMAAKEWSSVFTPIDDGGEPIPPDELAAEDHPQQAAASLPAVAHPGIGRCDPAPRGCVNSHHRHPGRVSGRRGAFLGTARNDARDALRHARVRRDSGSRDDPLRRQHIDRRGAWRGRHGAGSRRRHRHSPARSTDPPGHRPHRHPAHPSPHGPHSGIGFLWSALQSRDRRPHLGTCQQYAFARRPACRATSRRRCFQSTFAICRA